jgi:hypothetical protein
MARWGRSLVLGLVFCLMLQIVGEFLLLLHFFVHFLCSLMFWNGKGEFIFNVSMLRNW